MKKFVISLMIVILLLIVPGVTYAADVLYRMLHADEVESFKQDQDALIVGQLIDKQGDKFTVKVLKVLNGKVRADYILVSDDFTYGWDKTIPKVNDFCIFSLKRTGDYYKKAWGIFMATSGDYKTLKLEPLNAPTPGLLGDITCIQWYVNSGGAEKEFFGISSTMYVRRPNGQDVQIYPIPTTDTEVISYKSALNQIRDSPTRNTNAGFYSFRFVLLIAVVVLIGIGTAISVIARKGKVE